MPMSFPYPKNGSTIRPKGEGCKSCVFRSVCPAIFWLIRFNQVEPDDNNGRACLSWSNDPAQMDPPPTPTADDMAYIAYNGYTVDPNSTVPMGRGIASEANENGSPTDTGSSRQATG